MLFGNATWALWTKRLTKFAMRLRFDLHLCILLNLKPTLSLGILYLDACVCLMPRLLYAHEEWAVITLPRRWVTSSYWCNITVVRDAYLWCICFGWCNEIFIFQKRKTKQKITITTKTTILGLLICFSFFLLSFLVFSLDCIVAACYCVAMPWGRGRPV